MLIKYHFATPHSTTGRNMNTFLYSIDANACRQVTHLVPFIVAPNKADSRHRKHPSARISLGSFCAQGNDKMDPV
jgi:hypothetical protein